MFFIFLCLEHLVNFSHMSLVVIFNILFLWQVLITYTNPNIINIHRHCIFFPPGDYIICISLRSNCALYFSAHPLGVASFLLCVSVLWYCEFIYAEDLMETLTRPEMKMGIPERT